MTRVVLANEIGGGWGHILPLRTIAGEFIQRGCEVLFQCREKEKASRAFSGMDVVIEPSPAWVPRTSGFSLNYAQNLWRNGYSDENTLGFHFGWWLDRLQTLEPSFVLTDYAPTALLSALSLGIPRGCIGTGFTLPPKTEPMPSLHPWLDIHEADLRRAEKKVLHAIQKLVPSLTSIAGIFRGAQRFLKVFPELDHYEFRPAEEYWGPVLDTPVGSEWTWPEGSGSRVFLYMSANNRCLASLLNHVRNLGIPAVGVIRDLPESERKTLASPSLRLHSSLVDLYPAASECDIAVTQGGLHTTAAMLLSGARLLICPEQLEQTLLAYRLQTRGLCEFISFFSDADKAGEKFDSVASSVELGENAGAFAAKHAGYDSSVTVKDIVRICMDAA